MFKNMKISMKLALGFGMVLAVFATAVLFGWFRMTRVQEESRFLSKVMDALAIMNGLEIHMEDARFYVRDFQYSEADDSLTKARALLQETRNDIARGLQMYDATRMQGLKAVADMEAPLAGYSDNVEKVAALSREKGSTLRELTAVSKSLLENLGQLIELQYQYMKQELAAANLSDAERRLERIRAAESLVAETGEIRRAYSFAMVQRDAKAVAAVLPQVEAMRQKAQALLDETRREEVRAALKASLEQMERFTTGVNALVSQYTQLDELHRSRQPYSEALFKAAAEISQAGMKKAQEIGQDAVGSLGSAVLILVSMTVVALVVGLLIAFLISRMITKPLGRLVALAGRAGQGDLTLTRTDLNYEGRDEVGSLSDAVMEMIASQYKVVKEIVSLSETATASSGTLLASADRSKELVGEVKGAVESVVSLAESNSSSLEESNAGTEEMSAASMTAAQAVTECAEFISHTTTVSNEAVGKVQDMIRDMGLLQRKTQDSSEKLQELVDSVGKIGEFVGVITSIADQTNLLALNAAIEAARAGDAGRGFAVVAEEVRKLAEDSGRAASSVKGLITTLQSSTRETIEASGESFDMLTKTIQEADGAKASLGEVMGQIDNANDRIQNIAAVAEEQAASSREVATGIDSATKTTVDMLQNVEKIKTATDETARVSEDVMTQANGLAQLAQHLEETLSRFKIVSEDTPKDPKALK